MRKIRNPFLNTANGQCFGCSSQNTNGLQMEFFEDNNYVISHWKPQEYLSGFENILHGGIQTTLMDEIACWVVFVKLGTSGVTTSINASFYKPVFTNKGDITIRARLIETKGKSALMFAEILDHEETICSEAEVQYRIFPGKLAKEKLEYPGLEAFFDKN